jgi:hypothetical protein
MLSTGTDNPQDFPHARRSPTIKKLLHLAVSTPKLSTVFCGYTDPDLQVPWLSTALSTCVESLVNGSGGPRALSLLLSRVCV